MVAEYGPVYRESRLSRIGIARQKKKNGNRGSVWGQRVRKGRDEGEKEGKDFSPDKRVKSVEEGKKGKRRKRRREGGKEE